MSNAPMMERAILVDVYGGFTGRNVNSPADRTKLFVYRHVFVVALLETSKPLTGLGKRLMRGLPTTRETPFAAGVAQCEGADKVPGPVAADEPRSPNGQQVNASLSSRNRETGEPSGTEPCLEPPVCLEHLVCRECKGRSGISILVVHQPCRPPAIAEEWSRARRPRWTAHASTKPPRAVPARGRPLVAGESGPCPPRTVRDPRADRLFIDETQNTIWLVPSYSRHLPRQACDPHTDHMVARRRAQQEAWRLGWSPTSRMIHPMAAGGSERGLSSTPLTPLLFSKSPSPSTAHHHGRLVCGVEEVGWCFSCSPAHTR
jgi:hypothetical protein